MHGNANTLAYIALFAWPLISIPLFFLLRLPVAFAISILGADLLLPAGLDVKFEMIPAFDKNTIACLSAVIGCSLSARRLPFSLSSFRAFNVLIAAYLISPFITSVLNGDPVQSGDRVMPGVGLYDGGSAFILQFILISPLLLGRQIIRTDRDVLDVFRVLAISGTLYSVLLLLEVRFSPQLHFWIYGYYPSQFAQAIREGGFRPMAFMGHGLLASFFLMMCFLAATALWRLNIKLIGQSSGRVSVYLGVVLVACKSLGSLVYGLALAPLVRWAGPRTQLRVAAVLAVIGLTYPVTRAFDWFPDDALVHIAASISDDRAGSLKFRFDNEDQLLAKASERFWFGWGRYGRNRIYGEYGTEVITDGRWIITFGQFGTFGFISEFGLLALPIFLAMRAVRHSKDKRAALLMATVALIQAARIIDQLPNASINPWAWLLTGALVGNAEMSRRSRERSSGASKPHSTERLSVAS
ncbi:membrane protein [Bradyrhizobium sp.]|uniref:hypothetical protein n=1 Tax=Bradyrhizobium sp. TaxID=376 RepID=UPI0007C1D1DA|nr:hypothetical protein [Bradyrhizobium sp.]CUT11427.1 membrane protein [Bradyrhizobium sp.]